MKVTARILDYSYSTDQVAKDLELSKEIVKEAIDRLEKREIVRQNKRTENPSIPASEIAYILFVESMIANVIIRAAFEIANVERYHLKSKSEKKMNRKIQCKKSLVRR